MTEVLDVTAARRQGERYLRAARLGRWISLAVVALVVIAAQGCASLLLQPTAHLYFLDGGAWHEVDFPQGELPVQVLATDDGAIWVATNSDCGFLRYQNGAWSECAGFSTASTTYNYYSTSVTAHKNQVWSVQNRSVYQYDGSQWIEHEQVLTSGANYITATDSGVFIVDWNGNLTTYDGGGWQRQSLTSLLTATSTTGYYGSASMVGTEDGIVYISNGSDIHSYDGSKWSLLIGVQGVYGLTLLGSDGDLLWLYDGSSISTLDPSAAQPTVSASAAGLSYGYPTQMAFLNGTPYSLMGSTLYQWDGSRWQTMNPPLPRLNASSQTITFDSSGTLWLVSQDVGNFDPYREFRLEMGIFLRYGWWLIGLVGVILALSLRLGATRRRQRTQRMVWAALFDVPDLVTVQMGGGWYRAWRGLLALSISIAGGWIPYAYFRNSAFGQIAAALLVIAALALPIIVRGRGYRPPRRSRHTEDAVVREAHLLLLAGFSALILYVPLQLIWTAYDLPPFIGVIGLPALALFLSWMFTSWVYARAVKRLTALVKTGNLDDAEAQIAAHERWLPIQRQSISLYAEIARGRGQLHDAELLYRQMIYENQTNPALVANGLIQLADVLTQQGYGYSAAPLIETAIRIMPENPRGYEALAMQPQLA